MAELAEKLQMTPAEYLAFERAAVDEKHEYVDGEIFAMSGGTRNHSLIGMNAGTAFTVALLERPCEVYGSDMKVRTDATKYHYPDVTVVCGRALFQDAKGDVLLNPKVIVEVLSPSTERYDRGGKFESYGAIATLEEYILLSQDAVRVEHFHRQPDGSWLFRRLGAGDTLDLPSIQCKIPVDRLYLKVFEEGPPST